ASLSCTRCSARIRCNSAVARAAKIRRIDTRRGSSATGPSSWIDRNPSTLPAPFPGAARSGTAMYPSTPCATRIDAAGKSLTTPPATRARRVVEPAAFHHPTPLPPRMNPPPRPLQELPHHDVRNTNRLRQMTDQRPKKLLPHPRRGSLDDRAERLHIIGRRHPL